jgi:hypothetical protein
MYVAGDVRVEDVPDPSDHAAVVAAGLCGVIAAKRLGAEQIIIIMGRPIKVLVTP